MPEIVRHLVLALSGHVRRLHQDGVSAPREVEELTYFLVRLARSRHDPPSSASGCENGKDARTLDRLLLTKGEAAERLSVSVRTIERLAASGRLPQVHVERLARFRVTDLVAYVDSLEEWPAPDSAVDNHGSRLV
jgi:excisionase family DNA binding protein